MKLSESLLSEQLQAHIVGELQAGGGWLPFDRFMTLALYQPGLGYYANQRQKLGTLPSDGSDFVTAPELSPRFGHILARQVAEALQATATDEVWEFGAGSGALALQILTELGRLGLDAVRYRIVDLSGSLRARQQDTLRAYAGRVEWLDALPEQFAGVIVGNEVLDAMPVQLLQRTAGVWYERGVADADGVLVWQDRPTALIPPCPVLGEHDYSTEIHPQAEAFIRTLAERWTRGAAFFIDYGFPEAEYYHPQRHMGTLICHYQHKVDHDPLTQVGLKDITAHVNFTGIALAAQEAGLDVLGYASQGRFLINAGLLHFGDEVSLPERLQLPKLVNEHEMGELFKVLALAPAGSAPHWFPSGFAVGDRTHTL